MCFYSGWVTRLLTVVGKPISLLKYYRDRCFIRIFLIFSYLLNALLFYIFGESLNVLYLAGGFASAIILVCCYLLARNFVNRPIAFAYTFLVMTACVFNASIFNFIFPYSYSMVYSTAFCVSSTLFAILYLRNKREIFLILSFLLAGGALASKIEFIFLPIFFFSILAFQKKTIFLWIKSFLALIIFPLLCFLILFIQGLDLHSFIEALKTVWSIKNTEALKYFYTNFVSTYYSKDSIEFSILALFFFLIFFIGFTSVLNYFYMIKEFIKSSRLKFIAEVIFFSVLSSLAWVIIQKYELSSFLYNLGFGWLPIFLTIFTVICLSPFLSCNIKTFLLFTISIFSAIRGYFCLNLDIFGTFMLVLPLLSLLIIIYTKILFKKLNIKRNNLNRLVFSFFMMLAVLFLYNSVIKAYSNDLVLLETSKGKLFVSPKEYLSINNILVYLRDNSSYQDKILVIPEGQLISFLSERKMNNQFHSLIPIYIEAFGENKIIGILRENPPNYIIILALHQKSYGKSFVCKDYAEQICTYINNKYTLEESGSDDFYKIYKLNT